MTTRDRRTGTGRGRPVVAVLVVMLAVILGLAGCTGDQSDGATTAEGTSASTASTGAPSMGAPDPTTTVPSPTSPTGEVVDESLGYPSAGAAPTTLDTEPAAHSDPGEVLVFWAADSDTILLTTFGSSSCPRRVLEVTGTGDQEITLVTDAFRSMGPSAPTRTCTADLAPFTSVIEPPPGIRDDEDVLIRLDTRGLLLPSR